MSTLLGHSAPRGPAPAWNPEPSSGASRRAFQSAKAYGVLSARAYLAEFTDLVGPTYGTMSEAATARDHALHLRPCTDVIVVAQIEPDTVEHLGLDEEDLPAPGEAVFIDRHGRTPQALLRRMEARGIPLTSLAPSC